MKAIELAEMSPVTLVGDDTDLIVLLLHHANEGDHEITVMPQQRSGKSKVWKIKEMKKQLPKNIVQNILFLHSVLGCDTTSRLQGIGKGIGMKKLANSKEFNNIASVFSQDGRKTDEVAQTGEKALLVLYGGKKESCLDSLRQSKFLEKVSVKLSHVDPANLPPTSSSAKYHSYRVYLQVQQWRSLQCSLKPEDWGWKLVEGEYVPIDMDLPPAPSDLMQVIRCGCNGDCSSKACSCRKHSKECTFACSNCKGTSCSNSTSIQAGDLYEREEGN